MAFVKKHHRVVMRKCAAASKEMMHQVLVLTPLNARMAFAKIPIKNPLNPVKASAPHDVWSKANGKITLLGW